MHSPEDVQVGRPIFVEPEKVPIETVKLVPSKRMILGSVIFLISFLGACSSQNADGTPVSQKQGNSYPLTDASNESSSEATTQATEVDLSYATIDLPQATLRFKDSEGWSWRVTVQGGPNFLNAVKVVETSPPGKATGVVTLNPYYASYENLDKGRVAPQFEFALLIGLSQPIPSTFYGQEFYDGCYTQSADGLNSSFAVCEIGWKNPDGGLQIGFHMLGGPRSTYDLDEREETTIDSYLSFLNSPARSLYIAVPGTWGCVFGYDFLTGVWTDNGKGCEILGQSSDESAGSLTSSPEQDLVPLECTVYHPNESLPLQPCEKGSLIATIQQSLIDYGFSVEIDGYYGPSTQIAVAEFQRQNELMVTGVVDELTFDMLIYPAMD